ncbi:unnamed protein product [Orchesella dallaii]|uniref:Uncharacterized protein n=1 Tax=Orchesella dallaii TaxID=48710 RepID=A0ABP1RJF5_9HEXA
MGRRSFNRKPVAPKRELSGFEKTKRKREISLRSERDAAIAAKFFRKSSENFPSCSSGLEKSDKTNPELLVDQVVPDLGLIPAQQDWCPSVRRSTSVSGLLVDTAENSNLSYYNFSTSSVELDLKSNDEHDNLTSKSQTLFAEDNVDVTFESKQGIKWFPFRFIIILAHYLGVFIIKIFILHSVLDELDACDFDPSDPSTWTIPITLHQLNILRDSKPKQSSFDFIETNERTAFNPNIFMSPGGRKREWLLFSKSTNSLFCY